METVKLYLALNKKQVEMSRLEILGHMKEILGIGLKETKDLVDCLFEQISVSIVRNNDESLLKIVDSISNIKGITVLIEPNAIVKYRKALEESTDYIYVEKKLYESLLKMVSYSNSIISKLTNIVTEYNKFTIK